MPARPTPATTCRPVCCAASGCGHGFVGTAVHGQAGIYRYDTCYAHQRHGTARCDQERIPPTSWRTRSWPRRWPRGTTASCSPKPPGGSSTPGRRPIPAGRPTSTNPLIRALRTQLVPRVLPLALRFDRAVANGFRTISQLNISYRHSLAVQEGRPGLRRGSRAGNRLPDTRIARDGQACWLGEALVAPAFQLLLCGPLGDWHTSQLTALRHRYPDTLAVQYLTREATPGALHDLGKCSRALASTAPPNTSFAPTVTSRAVLVATIWSDCSGTSPAGSPTPGQDQPDL